MAKVRFAENVGALHTADSAELGLDDAGEVIRNLILVQVVGAETDVHGGELLIRSLQIDDRNLRIGRQIVLHLRDLA